MHTYNSNENKHLTTEKLYNKIESQNKQNNNGNKNEEGKKSTQYCSFCLNIYENLT